MTVAIISEDFAGMRAQAEGLTARLGVSARFYPVRLKGIWKKLPTRLCPDPLRAIEDLHLDPDTEWLLGVGGTGGAIGAALSRKTGLRIVQIQNPRMRLRPFDLVIANDHDKITDGNVLFTRTALHGVTDERLSQARDIWAPRLKSADKPLLSVMLGGSNGRFQFGRLEARTIGQQLAAMARQTPIKLAITPSRRTDARAVEALRKELDGLDTFIWSGEGENPYIGMLACADMIAVTQDSVSMISEAVATAVPVQVIPLPGRSRRIESFISSLTEIGRLRRFSPIWSPWEVSPLDDTAIAVEEVRKRLSL